MGARAFSNSFSFDFIPNFEKQTTTLEKQEHCSRATRMHAATQHLLRRILSGGRIDGTGGTQSVEVQHYNAWYSKLVIPRAIQPIGFAPNCSRIRYLFRYLFRNRSNREISRIEKIFRMPFNRGGSNVCILFSWSSVGIENLLLSLCRLSTETRHRPSKEPPFGLAGGIP